MYWALFYSLRYILLIVIHTDLTKVRWVCVTTYITGEDTEIEKGQASGLAAQVQAANGW